MSKAKEQRIEASKKVKVIIKPFQDLYDFLCKEIIPEDLVENILPPHDDEVVSFLRLILPHVGETIEALCYDDVVS
jgi:hypothetical protein